MSSSLKRSGKLPIKALVLAGGRGVRLKKAAKEINKCMLEFGGKPLIEYSLDIANKLRAQEIVIVVGHLAEQIINHFGNKYKGTPIKYAIQWEQKGLVHAIETAKNALEGSDFILLLGDEFLLNPDHRSLLEVFKEQKAFAVCGVIKVEDKTKISKTYSIMYDDETHRIFRLVEKPQHPSNNLMGTGNIIFKNEILSYIAGTPINQKRNEKELPDLIQSAIDDGKKVVYQILASTYVNVNTTEDMTIIKKMVDA